LFAVELCNGVPSPTYVENVGYLRGEYDPYEVEKVEQVTYFYRRVE